ncbi:MAG TPA: nitrous oxide-stimulated promoter family protein [Vicinamibacterales bacterium]
MFRFLPSVEPRAIALEKKTVSAMVRLYCADHHHRGDGPCPSCQELLAYAHQRLDRCPYGEAKPACKECPVHCYQPARRESMREVMREAGPKMLLHHPWLAILHLWKDRVRRTPPRPSARRKPLSPAP